MKVLGINRGHNSSVCLLDDGEVVFHIENERLSRIKYDFFPWNLLEEVQHYTDDLDFIAYVGMSQQYACELWTQKDAYTEYLVRKKNFAKAEIHDYWEYHHKMHATCAFYNSGFDEALIIVIDGMGSDVKYNQIMNARESISVYTGRYPAEFELVEQFLVSRRIPLRSDLPENRKLTQTLSPGEAYGMVATNMGWTDLEAGKVMGLSPYGSPNPDIPPLFVDGHPNPDVYLIGDSLHDLSFNQQYECFRKWDDESMRKDIAYAIQKESQENVLNYILQMIERTGAKKVCLTGGYFLNCVANYFYLDKIPSDVNMYVEPISSDAGTSMGVAKFVHHKATGDMTIRPQKKLYYGLNQHEDISLETRIVSPDDVAKLIADGNLVAMFQGKSESGPRALGNRSLLFDPRHPTGKDVVNRIKRREYFRPFAGSVMLQHAHEWFDMKNLDESPFMMFAVDVKEDKRHLIPAITHVDGTCRVQTVTRSQNENYYNLIEAFFIHTGVPILFNTSFNLAGEPLVETIEDAIRTLDNSEINYLYLPETNRLYTKGTKRIDRNPQFLVEN